MVVEILCGCFGCTLRGSQFVRDMRDRPCKKDGLSTSIRQIFNGREQNDSHSVLSARETRSYGRPKGVLTTTHVTTKRTTERIAFSGAKRCFVLQRLFSTHSFLARQKRMGRRRHTALSAHPKCTAGGRFHLEKCYFFGYGVFTPVRPSR